MSNPLDPIEPNQTGKLDDLPLPAPGTVGGLAGPLDGSGKIPSGQIPAGVGAVSSVFGRTGVVAAQAGDYTASQIGAATSAQGATADAAVPKATGSAADQVLVFSGSSTPSVVPLTPSTILGKKAAGATAALTGSEVRTIAGLATGDTPTFAGVVATTFTGTLTGSASGNLASLATTAATGVALGAAGSGTDSTTLTIASTSFAQVQVQELVDNLIELVSATCVLDSMTAGSGSDQGLTQLRSANPIQWVSGGSQSGFAEVSAVTTKYLTFVFSAVVAVSSVVLQAGPAIVGSIGTNRMPASGSVEWSADGSTGWTAISGSAFGGLTWTSDEIKTISSFTSPGAKIGWRIKIDTVVSGVTLRVWPQVRLLGVASWQAGAKANGIGSGIVSSIAQGSVTTVTIRNTLPYTRTVRARSTS